MMRFKNLTSQLIPVYLMLVLSSCSVLPINEEPLKLAASDQKTETTLSRALAGVVEENQGNSGHHLLLNAPNSLSERLWLADLAENTLDVQYFLWNSDTSGKLFLQSLLAAAERGVKVRILIDGFSIADRNDELALIQTVPNVEVRVYNPFVAKTGFGRLVSFAIYFERLNQRMHNKSLIADGTLAIVGGRNIGDHYFGYSDEMNFYDADILSVGPVVEEVTASFEDYWNSPWAISVSQLNPGKQLAENSFPLKEFLSEGFSTELNQPYQFTQLEKDAHLQMLKDAFIWAPSEFIADTPAGYQRFGNNDELKQVARKLGSMIREAEEEIIIESAYFVMDEQDLQDLKEIISNGVEVSVLTNSLASNNLIINHASYALFRDQMLDTGMNLFEMRPEFSVCTELGCTTNDKNALHAKTAIFDNETVYVGSMNFNLRSAFINTESGMIIHSPELAFQLRQDVGRKMNLNHCWQVAKLDDEIFWVGMKDGNLEVTKEEPQSNWLKRFEVDLITKLPGTAYY
ncbi:phospholipase D family protein [Reinekea marinisedimentorum]|uniref:Phosphatidylserine/phosphatidylglycerophosphate/ cardiolipin synthase-like enzyme n=1 Tax=Reinekea marinisedimentorum TaxID=230495 RepID=A0A4R3I9E0_9GAMM|nr:phospholipase D family protein [Reinekea marinisedimentorum]TCS42498.1 phosphatidylserine/phosphatidylglycerophosphate/cardiolipin synthase-like enzyme [Reinekea marinisedimentorum]